MVESGVGDTIQDIDVHIGKVMQFLSVDIKKAHQELLNLRQCIYMVANEIDVKHKATMCLLKKIDDKVWDDFTDSGINELYELLGGGTLKEWDDVREAVIGKIDSELKLYFPNLFESAKEKNYLDLVRRLTLLQLAEITEDADNKEEIEKLTKQIVGMMQPKNFEGTDSEEIAFDKQFEDMCLAISREFGGVAKNYSVMEFYSAYARMEKESEQLKKLKKKK